MTSSAPLAAIDRRELFPDGRRRADEEAGAVPGDAGAIGVAVGVRRRLLRARQGRVFAVLAAKPVQVHARGEALGLGIGVGADHRDGEDRVRLGLETLAIVAVAVQPHDRDRVDRGEVVREGEADADLRREPAAIVARAEQPDRRQRRVRGHRRDRPEGVALGEAAIPEDQLLQALEEIVAAARLLQTPEREGGELVGARRAAEAEVDPAREQRLERLEALGDDERGVVRQHHAAGADRGCASSPPRSGRS